MHDLHVFMEDGAELCDDSDLLPEIVEGKVLVVAQDFSSYSNFFQNGEFIYIHESEFWRIVIECS